MAKKKIRVMWHGFKGQRKVRDSGAIALQNLGNHILDQQRKRRKEEPKRTEPSPGIVKELKKWVTKQFRKVFCCFSFKSRNSVSRFNMYMDDMDVPGTSGMVSIFTTSHTHSTACCSYNSSWNPERCTYDSLDEYSEDEDEQPDWSKLRRLTIISPLRHEFIKMNGNARQRLNREKVLPKGPAASVMTVFGNHLELPGKTIDGNDVEIVDTYDEQHAKPFSSPTPVSEILQEHTNEIAINPNSSPGEISAADPAVQEYCSHTKKDFTGNNDSNSLNNASDSEEQDVTDLSESITEPSSSTFPLTTATELSDATLISDASEVDHMKVGQLEEDDLPISSPTTICPKLQLDNTQLATRCSSPLTTTHGIPEDVGFDFPKCGMPTFLEPLEHTSDIATDLNSRSGENSTTDELEQSRCVNTENYYTDVINTESLNESSDSDEDDYTDVSESTTDLSSSSTFSLTTVSELSDATSVWDLSEDEDLEVFEEDGNQSCDESASENEKEFHSPRLTALPPHHLPPIVHPLFPSKSLPTLIPLFKLCDLIPAPGTAGTNDLKRNFLHENFENHSSVSLKTAKPDMEEYPTVHSHQQGGADEQHSGNGKKDEKDTELAKILLEIEENMEGWEDI